LRRKRWTIPQISRTLGPSERTLRRWFKEDEDLPTPTRVRHNHEAIERELKRTPKVPAKQIARKFRCGIATVYSIRQRMLSKQQEEPTG
jgi:AraC-like DNA-binding protein